MFKRPNIYRMAIDERVRERKEVCIEFYLSQGAPVASAWVEQHVPERMGADGQWRDATVQKSPVVTVRGGDLVRRKRVGERDLCGYTVADALARDSVCGQEAGRLAWSVMWDWFVRGPASRSKPIAEAAPEWWRLVSSRKEET